jgi:ankyrin repeat protein
LQYLAEFGCNEIIDEIYKKHPELFDEKLKDEFGRTLMHFATMSNNVKTTKLLSKINPKFVYERDLNGHDPIYYAVRYNQKDQIYTFYLIDSSLIKQTYENGNSLMHLAARKGLMESLLTLQTLCEELSFLPNNDSALPVHYAAMGNSVIALEFFISKYPQLLQSRDLNVGTLMHFAASGDAIDSIQYLHGIEKQMRDRDKKYSLSIFKRDKTNNIPFDCAVFCGSKKAISFLAKLKLLNDRKNPV